MQADDIAVVHLVRHANGPDPCRRFLDSYRAHPAGRQHQLVLLCKGYAPGQSAEICTELAGDLHVSRVEVEDDGYDIGAYLRAAHELPHRRLCFVNSFTTVLAADWLALLAAAHDSAAIGLVGATGSWGSQTSHLRYTWGLGGPYSGRQRDRRETRRLFRSMLEPTDDRSGAAPGSAASPARARDAVTLTRMAAGFAGFPTPHIRTTGFLIDAELLRRVARVPPRDKLQTHLFESGRRGLTRRVADLGLGAVVVDRRGGAHTHRDWPTSATFWQRTQENLLLADNQTAHYARGGFPLRDALSHFAWGDQAEPHP